MKEIILVINAGSSSLKFKIFDLDHMVIASGQVEGIDLAPSFKAKDTKGEVIAEHQWSEAEAHNHALVLGYLIDWITETFKEYTLKACGHRVVHGGTIFSSSVLINEKVIADIESLIPLAPLHQPHNLRVIKLMREKYPTLPQVAVFDTAFHQTMQGNATMYAIPYELYKQGVRRYGMHGTSYAYIAEKLKESYPQIAHKKVVIAHIGSGASLCAIENGKSVMTTMGFTALDGVSMGTRPGSIDPGILLYLMENKGYGVDEIRDFIYYKCGAGGLSELSSNFYTLECNYETHEGAKRAFDFMTFRTAEEIARLSVSLGGIDALVFTAGVGENSAHFREEVCKQLAHLGIQIDQDKNKKRGEEKIHSSNSSIEVYAIPTNEELMIMLDTKKLAK
ncbi:acetate/propionate family kinase [Helicobacter kayseriensis]|uniref:acetate/propionate family kinase n=1 Tax=Helicobacter kayseriensis TaxID=2905877 RepID=UPI001E3E3E40|nr:acetate/propionate family kinase [Helicobacter kayseriensis]MCE3046639.1 acetate/propionate family kinase [Helicobacter kayseriensis]MCE3048059.1 acetate/propionate family kinase [Helicobacter kayseriensis]